MTEQIELLHRRIAREREARKQAEQIIEQKSRELYLKGQELERIAQAERQGRAEAEIMLAAFEAFSSKLDYRMILSHLQAFIQQLVSHDCGAVYFYKDSSLVLQQTWSNELGHPPLRVSASNRFWLLLQEALQPIEQTQPISEQDAFDWSINSATQHWLLVPMIVQGRKIGCISLQRHNNAGFCESSRRLLQALANQSASALENARLFEEVQNLSIKDPLTGVYNRRHFNQVTQQEMQRAKRSESPISAILMDIDFFKKINDSYGHASGDKVLVDVAQACKERLRNSDLLARYGGEEFCFLLPETAIEDAQKLADRVRLHISKLSFEYQGTAFTVTASFGVAQWYAKDDTLDTLLNRCDQALYQAKHQGRNCVVVENGDLDVEIVNDWAI